MRLFFLTAALLLGVLAAPQAGAQPRVAVLVDGNNDCCIGDPNFDS